MKRPLVWGAASLCAGIVCGYETGKAGAGFASGVLVGLCAVVILIIVKYYKWKPAALLLLFLAAGFFRVAGSLYNAPRPDGDIEFTGVVRSIEATANSKKVVVAVRAITDGAHAGARYNVLCWLKDIEDDEGRILTPGDIAIFYGGLQELDRSRNPGAFDEKLYYRARKIMYKSFPTLRAVASDDRVAGVGLSSLLSDVSSRLADVFYRILPNDEAAVMCSIVLGDKTGLDENARDLYREGGIYHLLCVSGLHVSIIAMSVNALLGRFLDKRKASLITLAALVLYCVFTGGAVSTARATIMAGVLIGGNLFYRESDLASSTACAAIILLLYEPLYLYDAGFLLSFGAVFGIAVARHPFEILLIRLKCPKAILSGVSASMAAAAGTFPAQSYFFYVLAPYSIIINILVIPTAAMLVCLGLAAGAIGLFWIEAAIFLAGSLHGLLLFYKTLCGFSAWLPYSQILTGSCGLPVAFAFIGLCFLFALYMIARIDKIKRARWAFIAGLLCFATCVVIRAIPPTLEITMLDVGQGDAIVIRQGHDTYLIDGGGLRGRNLGDNTGSRTVAPYLDYLGINRLSGVFVSHPDTDHITGVIEIAGLKTIDKAYFAKAMDPDNLLFQQFLSVARAEIVYLEQGDVVTSSSGNDAYDGCAFDIVYPPADARADDPNDLSLVIQLRYEKARVLFTGDISGEIEKNLEFKVPTVLKLSHHGSRFASDIDYLAKSQAPFALVSAGRGNSYGHPSSEVLSRLYDLNIKLYNTQISGAVMLSYRNSNFTVREQCWSMTP
ncbi:MAG: DNA internalization-related competence protein ComEC/Rec2 [Clostridiales bacterium]|jgi:competence protein ComEC|nr:DNA internalization-related competence protein ComEC/Rec2 [Clostridiales bacterium]